jgi:hypothetical protein
VWKQTKHSQSSTSLILFGLARKKPNLNGSIQRNKNSRCVGNRADLLLVTRVSAAMATVLYQCPKTGFRVQRYTRDETITADQDIYAPVTCLACRLRRLVNPKTGKVLVAGDQESKE